MKKLRILLIGSSLELMRPLPFLFFRAGFEVDALSVLFSIQNKFVSNLKITSGYDELLEILAQKNLQNYDFIQICDDETLRIISQSNFSVAKKLELLPIKTEKDFRHLYSKIGLSQVLQENQIFTPPFFVTKNFEEAKAAATNLDYPVMLKLDCESGGKGVFECKNFSDLAALDSKIFTSPVLVQKKIEGVELDLSGFYRHGKLVNFSYSVIEKILPHFGPSYLRTYQQLSEVEQSIFLEMEKLGEALGANGFVTISAIKSNADGKNYFFEADMRPNAWADHTRFFGDDLAVKISDSFCEEKTLKHPQPFNKNYPKEILVPLFIRLNFFEILFNRYNVWFFISASNFDFFYEKISRKPKFLLWKINRIPTATIRLFLPQKEQRVRVRFYFKKLLRFTELST